MRTVCILYHFAVVDCTNIVKGYYTVTGAIMLFHYPSAGEAILKELGKLIKRIHNDMLS